MCVGKRGIVLQVAGQREARRHAHHAYPGCQRLCQHGGGCRQRGLGQRVRQEVRIQVEELLVQQIDDDALNRCRRQLAGQGLGQQQRCHQIGHQVLLQALGRERADVVVFKA